MWGQGYVTDVEYTSSFFPMLAPSHLRFILTLKGIESSSTGPDFDYLELGFGQGVTITVLAAANPKARFWANDFNPTHVQRARNRADAACLSNVTFLERSFADMASLGLPKMDFIVLHGVYSWISADNQHAIVRFLDGHLKPGGVVYISYNTIPGWSPVAPMQWLARTFADRIPAPSGARLKSVAKLFRRMQDSETGYFKAHPGLRSIVGHMEHGSRNYAIHEYLNAYWHLTSHHEIAHRLGEARLSFVASSDATALLEHFVLGPRGREILQEFADDPLRETVKDFLTNNNFRRDVFVRGGIALSGAKRTAAIGAVPVTLIKPRADCDLAVKFPIGSVELSRERHLPILDALAERPHTIAELAGGAGDREIAAATRSIVALAAAGYVGPCAPGGSGALPPEATAATQRLNGILLEETRQGATHRVLASPVLGSGIAVDPLIQRGVLTDEDPPEDPELREKLAVQVAGYRPLLSALGVAIAR